jgi:hypothetical protein
MLKHFTNVFEWHKSVPRPCPKNEAFLSTKFKGIKYWPSQSEKKNNPSL